MKLRLAIHVLVAGALLAIPVPSAHAADLQVSAEVLPSPDPVARSEARQVVSLEKAGGSLKVVHHRTQSQADAVKLADQLEDRANVVEANVDNRVVAAAVPLPVQTAARATDPRRSDQWDMDKLEAEDTWAHATGVGQVVAVIDTGVEATHSDLAGQVLNGMDTITPSSLGRVDPHGHGTHIAGTIAAVPNNAVGLIGLAPGSKILPIRVLDASGSGWSSDVTAGIIWATDNGATVINLSLASTVPSDTQRAAIQYAIAHGVVVVAAAGNYGNSGNPVVYPGAYPEVLCVGATDALDLVPAWSEYGSQVDLAAPGSPISSTYTGNSYQWMSGTSMAAPHVAAAVALVRSKYPSLDPGQVITRLTQTAQDKGSSGRDDYYGYGLVDPLEALTSSSPLPTTTIPPTTTTTTTAPPTTAPPSIPSNPAPAPAPTRDYWLVAQDGGVFAFGSAPFYGSTGNIKLNQPIVGMSATPSGNGYWFVASDGGVFSYGDAGFFGSTGSLKLNRPIVGMTTSSSGKGYWLVASDGGIFAFGDAGFYGSTGSIKLNQPIVGMSATPTGKGYWLVASDGGIFAFGDAGFYGSTGSMRLNQPIVGMSSTASGSGYRLVASDGGIFAFGDAPFYGSPVGTASRVVSATSARDGYVMADHDGRVYAYSGDGSVKGSNQRMTLNSPVVGLSFRG